uniref:MULE transposase domain-containing protein n=1 Tax=Lactuca sativa TaxID=4236 RepID=A0A9R1X825_LACSA|nr:hypothetical protein LSAT_V11C500273850 [Lactuca sativa]
MDAAHLKGKYKGTILHEVVMDGNNQILPIGYGIFPKETTNSWTWFLEKLHESIGDLEGMTLVMDKAASNVVSIQNVFPNSQHGLKSTTILTKLAEAMVNKNKEGITGCSVFGVDKVTYQVHEFKSGGIVNLRQNTYSLNYWQLIGLSCSLEITVLMHLKNENCGHMVSDIYIIETYRRTYEGSSTLFQLIMIGRFLMTLCLLTLL